MSFVDYGKFKAFPILLDGLQSTQERRTDEPYNIKIHHQLKPFLTFFNKGKEKSIIC